jgi:hypothetical protein
MAIFRRYAAMFRVGTSFIFSSIKSRSASVTLNLICTVLFRPSIASLLSFPFRGFGTLPNKQFSTDAPQRGRGNEPSPPAWTSKTKGFYPVLSFSRFFSHFYPLRLTEYTFLYLLRLCGYLFKNSYAAFKSA